MRNVPWILLAVAACSRGGYDVEFFGNPLDGLAQPLWKEVGGSASGGGVSNRGATANCKRTAISSNGLVYALWADNVSGTWQTYLRRWTGTAWGELGGSGSGLGVSGNTPATEAERTCPGDIAFDAADQPLVIWQNDTGFSQPLYGRRWSGAAWVELGGSASGGGISGGINDDVWWPTLAVDNSGQPIAAWCGTAMVFVRRFNGTAWVGLGGSDVFPGLGDASARSQFAVVRAAADGNVFVAWLDNRTGAEQIYLARWDGSAWSELAGSNSPGGLSQGAYNAGTPVLRLMSNGDPVVAWANVDTGEIHVRRWTGSAWGVYGADTLTAAGLVQAPVYFPDLLLDTLDRPIVAWAADDTVGHNAHVGGWNGTSWQTLDPGPGGVSNTALWSDYPSLALGPDGAVYLAWEQQTPTATSELYLRVLRTE